MIIVTHLSCVAGRSSPEPQQQGAPVPAGQMGFVRLPKKLPRKNGEQQTGTLETASFPPATQSTPTAPFVSTGSMSCQEEKGLGPRSGKSSFRAAAPSVGEIFPDKTVFSLFSHLILDQGTCPHLPVQRPPLATIAAAKTAGRVFTTEQAPITSLTTEPQQLSCR